MMKSKIISTSILVGPALDWAVANASGYSDIRVFTPKQPSDTGWVEVRFNPKPRASTSRFCPSTDWAQAGPIIERELINLLVTPTGKIWSAYIWYSGDTNAYKIGPTPLTAAMRCYVASKLGDEIKIPEEL